LLTQISSSGVDGEELHLTMPSQSEVSNLVATSESELKRRLGIDPTTFDGSNVLHLKELY
jgi:alpha-glucosidase